MLYVGMVASVGMRSSPAHIETLTDNAPVSVSVSVSSLGLSHSYGSASSYQVAAAQCSHDI